MILDIALAQFAAVEHIGFTGIGRHHIFGFCLPEGINNKIVAIRVSHEKNRPLSLYRRPCLMVIMALTNVSWNISSAISRVFDHGHKI